jgi:hypothetical protein
MRRENPRDHVGFRLNRDVFGLTGGNESRMRGENLHKHVQCQRCVDWAGFRLLCSGFRLLRSKSRDTVV